ncbi:MAG TPA: TRAP transporter substrate-binding protein [Candidatus Sulfotelmatobacter sp.]|nr:TRAP transporter substrate-binding protein [Candidatus Sulfotelmatobacter sp.]
MQGKTTRGAFITSSAAAFASIAVVRSPARAAQWTYKAGTNQPVDHPLSVAMKNLWDTVRAETGGKLDVQTFPNNQLGGDTAMLQQMRSGALQFMTLDGAILASVVPVAAIQGVGFAFKDSAQAFQAFDGKLGAYIRNDIASKGLFAFDLIWENGMRNITSSTHPVKNAADLSGFKIRTPEGRLYLDLFKSLGAAPTPINFSELYTSLQTHVVDGQENPLLNIEFARFYEVQKYLSMSAHMWSGYWLMGNADVWKGLPPDVQAIVSKNARLAAQKQRTAVVNYNNSLAGKLRSQGMAINEVDREGLRAKLGAFYGRWKDEFGPTAWGLLEEYSGKLG